MIRYFESCAAAVALVICAAGSLYAAAPPSESQIQVWVNDLNAELESSREAAIDSLNGAGAAAIGPVAIAAEGNDRTTSKRAMDMLEKLYGSDDAATRTVAKSTITIIAATAGHPGAQRATQILAQPPAPAANKSAAGASPAKKKKSNSRSFSIQRRTVNGNRVVEADMNGDKVTITQSATGEISMNVVKGGKGAGATYAGSNYDEFSKNCPSNMLKIYQALMGSR